MTEKKRKKRSDADVTDYTYESFVGGSGASDDDWKDYQIITRRFSKVRCFLFLVTSDNDSKPRTKRGDPSLTGRTYEFRTASLNNISGLANQVEELTKKVEKLTKKVESLEKLFLKMQIDKIAETLEKLTKSINAKKK